MNSRFAVALARYVEDPSARHEIRRLRREPLAASERLEVGRRLLELDDAPAAALWLFAARRESPGDATVAYRLANALRKAGRNRAAEGILRSLTREYPAWAEPAQSLAWLYRGAHQAESAAAVLERWAAAVNHPPKALRATIAFLQDMGLDERAESLLAGAQTVREDPVLLLEWAKLLLRLGRFNEAERVLHEVTRRAPDEADAYFRLAYVRRWRDADTSPLELLRSALERPGFDAAARAALLFALAKVNDDLGRYADAFVAVERANALRARSARFDRVAWGNFERTLFDTFTAEFFGHLDHQAASAEEPVFVVGMPRSGTTLIERRLAAHPALTGVGELELIETLGRELAGSGGYPRGLVCATAAGYARAAREWRARLPEAVPANARIVDKNPLNFLHLGLIAAIFPRARIVHCRRDSLDTALSVYFQNFAHPRNDYAYRAEDIAWMMAFYRRVMAHWARVLPLPLPVHVLDYEAFVAAPERELRRLLKFLDLPWDNASLAADCGGAIATASLWQARQPVYDYAVGRARRYEPWIAPLKAALAQAGIRDTASAPRGSPG